MSKPIKGFPRRRSCHVLSRSAAFGCPSRPFPSPPPSHLLLLLIPPNTLRFPKGFSPSPLRGFLTLFPSSLCFVSIRFAFSSPSHPGSSMCRRRKFSPTRFSLRRDPRAPSSHFFLVPHPNTIILIHLQHHLSPGFTATLHTRRFDFSTTWRFATFERDSNTVYLFP